MNAGIVVVEISFRIGAHRPRVARRRRRCIYTPFKLRSTSGRFARAISPRTCPCSCRCDFGKGLAKVGNKLIARLLRGRSALRVSISLILLVPFHLAAARPPKHHSTTFLQDEKRLTDFETSNKRLGRARWALLLHVCGSLSSGLCVLEVKGRVR